MNGWEVDETNRVPCLVFFFFMNGQLDWIDSWFLDLVWWLASEYNLPFLLRPLSFDFFLLSDDAWFWLCYIYVFFIPPSILGVIWSLLGEGIQDSLITNQNRYLPR